MQTTLRFPKAQQKIHGESQQEKLKKGVKYVQS